MPDALPAQADVVIVGAGPAGLAAAIWLKQNGMGSVLVLEREMQAGGIPRHCGHFPFGMREFGQLLRGPDYAARLVRLARSAGVDIRLGVSVLGLRSGPSLMVTSDRGVDTITAKRVLLATGVREAPRSSRLIGGTKPGGVLSTGALQGMIYLDGLRPFRRPVILGSELVAFSAILTCRHLGINPVAMIEPQSQPTARWPAALLPRLLGIPLLCDTEIRSIEGEATVTGVTLRDGNSRQSHIVTDGVIVTGQFQPEASLIRASHLKMDSGTTGPEVDEFGRCNDADFFAAGNVLRAVETAGASWAEGRAVAAAILQSLRGQLPEPQGASHVTVVGPALKYVMPQRVVSGATTAALPALQLRLTRQAKGRLLLSQNGQILTSHKISSRPERRISLPLPKGKTGTLTITLEEGGP